jgi:endo-1,4-beta-xylanase
MLSVVGRMPIPDRNEVSPTLLPTRPHTGISTFVRAGACLSASLGLGLTQSVSISAAEPEPSLAEVFQPFFAIGMGVDQAELHDPATWDLVRRHAGSITVENAMKPRLTHAQPLTFTFERADRIVDAALAEGLEVHGHTLVWHRQSPDWFFAGDEADSAVSREVLLARLRAHIAAVAGHFRGRVVSWDVVNEALAGHGSEETYRPSEWWNVLGFEYIAEAFKAAAKADPEALLFYNDYNLETEPKRSRALELVHRLREKGIRIDGIGIQAHLQLDYPSIEQIERSIEVFRDAGLLIHISELDVSLYPWREEGSELLPEETIYDEGLTEDAHERLAKRYGELFDLFLRHHESITKVTFWNSHDGRSWLNHIPVRGRIDHPLLFDRQLQPKPAFFRVVETARKHTETREPEP